MFGDTLQHQIRVTDEEDPYLSLTSLQSFSQENTVTGTQIRLGLFPFTFFETYYSISLYRQGYRRRCEMRQNKRTNQL